jgi:DNA polymerase-1
MTPSTIYAVDVRRPDEWASILPEGVVPVACDEAPRGEGVVLVALGKKAAETLLGRGVNMFRDVGGRFEDESGTSVVVQHSPFKVMKEAEKKGGAADRILHDFADVWDFAFEVARRGVPEAPEVMFIEGKEDLEGLMRVLRTHSGPIAYDYETWGDRDARRPELNGSLRILSIGVAWNDENHGPLCASFVVDHPRAKVSGLKADAVLRSWRELMESGRTLVAHNAKYEHKVNLRVFGKSWPCRDTMLESFTLDESASHSLGAVMRRAGVLWQHKDGTGADPLSASVPDLLTYNGLDAMGTLLAHESHAERLDEVQRSVVEMKQDFAYGLAVLEMTGIHSSAEERVKVRAELTESLRRSEREVFGSKEIKEVERHFEQEFNPKSPPMMQHLVFKVLNLKSRAKTKSGGRSLDKKVLEKLANEAPLLRDLMKYKSDSAMITGFLDKWDQYVGPSGRLHGQFNMDVTLTNRLSSTDPNLQNIPNRSIVKRVFSSRYGSDGILLCGDYSQQEPRLMAGMSGCRGLIEAINGGFDTHRYVAARIFGIRYEGVDDRQREVGKRMNLGIIYGQTEYGLAGKTGMSVPEARDVIRQYDREFPEVRAWKETKVRQAMENGWVDDLFGCRRHLPEIRSHDAFTYERAKRQAGNAPIQSSAAGLTMLSLRALQESLLFGADVVLQIHDSIFVDVELKRLDRTFEAMRKWMLIHNEMPYWAPMGVPFKVDFKAGPNMLDMQPVEC